MAYIPKSLDRSSITEALEHVLAGEIWQPGEGTEGAAPPTEATVAERLKALTPQQDNILRLMVAGKPNKIIAYELGIAETTVKAHVTLILRKLGRVQPNPGRARGARFLRLVGPLLQKLAISDLSWAGRTGLFSIGTAKASTSRCTSGVRSAVITMRRNSGAEADPYHADGVRPGQLSRW